MIDGVGVDMTTVARVAKSMERPGFLEKMFGPEELALFQKKGMRPETVAANFAAKEALGKALGTGLAGFAWHEAQALRDDAGAPVFAFSGAAARMLKEKGLAAHLSVSHEGGFALAFVVLERARPCGAAAGNGAENACAAFSRNGKGFYDHTKRDQTK